MDFSPAGPGRTFVSLVVFALLALAAWATMEDSKFRTLTWVLLAFFSARVVLGRLRSR